LEACLAILQALKPNSRISAVYPFTMLPKTELKFIKSLKDKKNRYAERLFVTEGKKLTGDLIAAGVLPNKLYVVRGLELENEFASLPIAIEEVSTAEMEQMSNLQSARDVLAVFPFLEEKTYQVPGSGLVLALDTIQDPGNFGTILRLADWYGVKAVVCSLETADLYNPKVIQATMGSLARVQVNYVDLELFFDENRLPVFGAVMEGVNPSGFKWNGPAILLIGNEGKGIRPTLDSKLTRRLSIPRFGYAESLNAAVATGIVLDNLLNP